MGSAKLLVCLVVCLLLFDATGTAFAKKSRRSEKKDSRDSEERDEKARKLSSTVTPSVNDYAQNEQMIYELVDKLIAKIHMLNKLLRTKSSEQCLVPYDDQRGQTFQAGPPMNAPYASPAPQQNNYAPRFEIMPDFSSNAIPPASYHQRSTPNYSPSFDQRQQSSPIGNQPYQQPQPSEPPKQYSELVQMEPSYESKPQEAFHYGSKAESGTEKQVDISQSQYQHQQQQSAYQQQQQQQQQPPYQHQQQPFYQPQPQPQLQIQLQPQPQPQAQHIQHYVVPPRPLPQPLQQIIPHQIVQQHIPAIKYSISVPVNKLKPTAKRSRLRTSAIFGVNKNENQNLLDKESTADSEASSDEANSDSNANSDSKPAQNPQTKREREFYQRLFSTDNANLPRYIKEYYQLQKSKFNMMRAPYQRKREATAPAEVPTRPRSRAQPVSLNKRGPLRVLRNMDSPPDRNAQAENPSEDDNGSSYERPSDAIHHLSLPSSEALSHFQSSNHPQQYAPTIQYQQQQQQFPSQYDNTPPAQFQPNAMQPYFFPQQQPSSHQAIGPSNGPEMNQPPQHQQTVNGIPVYNQYLQHEHLEPFFKPTLMLPTPLPSQYEPNAQLQNQQLQTSIPYGFNGQQQQSPPMLPYLPFDANSNLKQNQPSQSPNSPSYNHASNPPQMQYNSNGHQQQYSSNGQPPQYSFNDHQQQYNSNGQPPQYNSNGQPSQYSFNVQQPQYSSNGQQQQYSFNDHQQQYNFIGQPSQYSSNGQQPQYSSNGQQMPSKSTYEPKESQSSFMPRGQYQPSQESSASTYQDPRQGRSETQDLEKSALEYKRLIESLERKSQSQRAAEAGDQSDDDNEDEDEDDEEKYSERISKNHELPDRYKSYLDELQSSLVTNKVKPKKTDLRVENVNTNKNKYIEYLKQQAKALGMNDNFQRNLNEGGQVYQVDHSVKGLLDAIGYGNEFEGHAINFNK